MTLKQLSRTDVAVRYVVMLAMVGSLMFLCAGTVKLPFFWLYLGSMLCLSMSTLVAIDSDLLNERLRPAEKGTDHRFRLAMMPIGLAYFAIAGLDARFDWTGPLPVWLQALGLAGYVGSMCIWIWAMHVNTFFSSEVRIQENRGHRVITTGPYAFVRHPGYAIAQLMLPCAALALGSIWALIPIAPVAIFLLYRAWFEDRFLRENLEGYESYARSVRFRILPGIW